MKRFISFFVVIALLICSFSALLTANAAVYSYTVTATNHNNNQADDGVKLIDGVKSTADFESSAYNAWTGTDVEFVLNFGKQQCSDTYTVYTAGGFWGVSPVAGFTVSYSDSASGSFTAVNGTVTSTLVGEGKSYTSSDGNVYTQKLYEVTLKSDALINAQYIKFNIPRNGSFIWIDEIEATLSDSYINSSAVRVHHVDSAAGTDEISLYTSLSNWSSTTNGWGYHYQLRPTGKSGEYTIVKGSDNPRGTIDAAGTTYSSDALISETGFTDVSGDIYMVVKGAAANGAMYWLTAGTTVNYINLNLSAGNYTNIYVYAGETAKTSGGMINNAIEETNLLHSVANVQIVDTAQAKTVLSAGNGPANAYFHAEGADLVELLGVCMAYGVLPTIQVDDTAQANALLSAMQIRECYDVNVVSTTAAPLQVIRNATSVARTGYIYNLTKYDMTSDEANSVRMRVRSNPASFLVTNSNYVSKHNVRELQELGVAVWVKIDSAAGTDAYNEEVMKALAAGANGVITPSASNVSSLISTHFVKNTMTHTPIIVGHRGNPTLVTENTLESFISAYENGADVFELDVYPTTDNRSVIFHDYSLGTSEGLRLTTFTGTLEEGRLQNMSSDQIKQYKYQTGEEFAFLDEVLAYFQDKDIRLFVEFKGSATTNVPVAAATIKEYGMEDRVVVISGATSFLDATFTNFSGGVTSSYIYYNQLLTGVDEYTETETREETLEVLYLVLDEVQAHYSNLSPVCTAVAKGYLGEATTNRGLILSPWGYGTDASNNVGYFSNIDTLTIDGVEWCTDMFEKVTAEDITMAVGQIYCGGNLNGVTQGRETIAIDADDTIVSVISGDAVAVIDGKLTAVKEGTAKVIFGHETKTASGSAYVLYSDVVTVTVSNGNADCLKPLIDAASSATPDDFSEADLANLRSLYVTACDLVNSGSSDSQAISETAAKLSAIVSNSYGLLPVKAQSYATSGTSHSTATYVDDLAKLIDGTKNYSEGSSDAYSGWQGDVEITVDLGSAMNSNTYMGYFTGGQWGISAPSSMTISYLAGDGSWKDVSGSFEAITVADTDTWDLYKYVVISDTVISAQKIKFTVKASGSFIWMDEVEVYMERGAYVEEDYVYITGSNSKITTGDAHIFTPDLNGGAITQELANHRWTRNVVAKWSDTYQAYIITSNTHGDGTDVTFNLAEDEILISVHKDPDSEASVINMSRFEQFAVGQQINFYGVDPETGDVGLAAYVTTSVPVKVPVVGDVDDDGELGVSDYLILRRLIMGAVSMESLADSENAWTRCDINGDGKLSVVDYFMLRCMILGG